MSFLTRLRVAGTPGSVRSTSRSILTKHHPRFNSTSPASPPLHNTPPSPRKLTHRTRNAGIVVGVGLGAYFIDQQFNSSALSRTARTAYYGALMAADFKLNFNPENSDSIDKLHERVAWRLHHICVTNGGLYIKLAQSVALQLQLLPPVYREAFGTIFDQAPSVPFDEVVKVFTSEFGISPDDAFDNFSRTAIASASIAQVHKARIKIKEGEKPYENDQEGWVAVKIRKPSVPRQIDLDLFAYRTLLYCFEQLFDLPVTFVGEYVSEQMRKEVDLAHEARNSEKMLAYVLDDVNLRDKVSVPRIVWEYTGASVMTADYIEACKLTDKESLDKMGLSVRTTMDIATAVFAAMTFKFGFVHADPHPGNILVRKHPNSKFAGQPQIVLIDHGLCIELSEKFRYDYSLLWRSLFVGDVATIERIGTSWGIAANNSDMLASATLLRPHRLRKQRAIAAAASQTTYEQQVGLKERVRSMLENEKLIPRELILLARSMRMIQANNQALGSPSNRINILAHWAVTGLAVSSTYQPTGIATKFALKPYIWEKTQLLIFQVALFAIDLGFVITQIRQWVLKKAGGKKEGEGFEDILQRQVSAMAREEFGVELDESAFTG